MNPKSFAILLGAAVMGWWLFKGEDAPGQYGDPRASANPTPNGASTTAASLDQWQPSPAPVAATMNPGGSTGGVLAGVMSNMGMPTNTGVVPHNTGIIPQGMSGSGNFSSL
jgi:hypothetical protein